MNRVFVVQNTRRKDLDSGLFVSRFDLKPAEQWGKLIELVSPTAKPFNARALILEMKAKLHSFSDDDFILPVGNTSIIGMAVKIAADANGGKVKLLQWSGTNESHVQIMCDFNPK